MIMSALLLCSPRGVRREAMSETLALRVASGVGYCSKNFHKTGKAAVPSRDEQGH